MNEYKDKIGLALSGGGYRAAAFHIGTLRALHNLGILDKVNVISGVSGGAIAAAYYALNKNDFDEFEKSFTKKLTHGVLLIPIVYVLVIIGVIQLISLWVGICGLLFSLLVLYFFWYYLLPVSKIIQWRYDKQFFRGAKLKNLPESPVVSINATDIATANQFYFSKEFIGNYRYKYESFNAKDMYVSEAVMASSCVPFAFSPIRIPNKYFTSSFSSKESPLLFDGGLYDNQGAHCLTEKSSNNKCQYIIISDAGNDKLTNKRTYNPFIALWKTSDVLMERIKNMQTREYVYYRMFPESSFAQVKLEWDVTDRLLSGFIENLKNGNISTELINHHGITEQDIQELKNSDTEKETRARIMKKLKTSVHWNEYLAKQPSQDDHAKANKVSTCLIKLSKQTIYILSTHAEWMTYIQVRLYLPFILNEK